jgi:hypothetical protein
MKARQRFAAVKISNKTRQECKVIRLREKWDAVIVLREPLKHIG